MERITLAERPDWQDTAERDGFRFHTFDDGPYWYEKAAYRFTLREIEEDLEDVTDENAADVSDVPGFNNLPGATGGNTDSGDSLFDQAVAIVARERKASTSFVQRHLQIGYNRAARIIEDMEAQGMIGKPNHVGKREVLLPEVAEQF